MLDHLGDRAVIFLVIVKSLHKIMRRDYQLLKVPDSKEKVFKEMSES